MTSIRPRLMCVCVFLGIVNLIYHLSLVTFRNFIINNLPTESCLVCDRRTIFFSVSRVFLEWPDSLFEKWSYVGRELDHMHARMTSYPGQGGKKKSRMSLTIQTLRVAGASGFYCTVFF